MRRPLRVESRVLRVERSGRCTASLGWRRRPQPSTLNPQPSRGGTSLIEVMMATLVFGVGVLSVMTLFPIAYLRSIQASQLTNGALLQERAEATIDLFDLTSDLYIPQPDVGFVNRCIIDPLGIFDNLDPTYGYPVPAFYDPGAGDPDYFDLAGAPQTDTLDIPLRRLGFQGANPYNGVYLSAQPDLFPLGTREEVLDAVGLPDRWETVFSAVPSASGPLQVTFDLNEVDVNDLASLVPLADTRMVMVDVTGKRSEVRTPSLITPDTGSGTGTMDWTTPLPGTVGTIADCRVEVPDRRFTWLLTVRKTGTAGGSTVDVDVVIYHNRPVVDPEEELVHPASMPTVTTVPLDISDQLRAVDVGPFETYSTADGPPLRKGGYVFDPAHAHWYRVQDIIDETATSATLILDRPPTPTNGITVLTIPRGVVGVYPLTPRTVAGR